MLRTLGNWLHMPQARYTLDGRLLIRAYQQKDTGTRRWGEFLFIGRNGYVEHATAHFAGHIAGEDRTWFGLTPIVGRCWAFLSFVCDLYRMAGVTGSFPNILQPCQCWRKLSVQVR